MPENDNSPPSNEGRRFIVRKIYTKDISFETPNSPQIFTGKRWVPDVNVQLNNKGNKVNKNVHEVVLTVTVTVTVSDLTAYLVEIQQAGLFHVEGITDEELPAIIGSYCPTILFPYAREAISNLVIRGGFPQLVLNPVNFEVLYVQHLKELQEREQAQEQTTTH